jgi:DNA polymerase III gamma/tau subunit
MPLHIDYRPNTLDELIGNEGIKESIRSVFTREDKPHAVLMTGPKGSGKTTIGRIIATMTGCSLDDVQEINCALDGGVDLVRGIRENIAYGALNGSVKFIILDECHCLTKGKQGAQNGLLKIMEDTPKHVFFVLCTTDPEQMLPALVSRCMKFEVKSLVAPQMTKLLEEVIIAEGIDLAAWSKDITKEIVRIAEGCPRQALLLLDSVIDITDDNAALAALAEATATETASIDICRLLLENRKGRWDDMKFLLAGLLDKPEEMRYAILGYMATVMMSKNCQNPDHVSRVIDQFTESFMYSGKAGLVNACFQACKL